LREEGSLDYDGGLVRLHVQTNFDTIINRQHCRVVVAAGWSRESDALVDVTEVRRVTSTTLPLRPSLKTTSLVVVPTGTVGRRAGIVAAAGVVVVVVGVVTAVGAVVAVVEVGHPIPEKTS
jgi:hypothetical protein